MDLPVLESQGSNADVLEGKPKEDRNFNWAKYPHVRKRIETEIVPLVNAIRNGRMALTEEWFSLWRVLNMEHEEDVGYVGDSRLYMPAGRKVIETLAPQLVGATFPGEDYFGVDAVDPSMVQDANSVKQVLRHRIENTANVRVWAEKFYRQLLVIGNSPVKVYYRRKMVNELRRRAGAVAWASTMQRSTSRIPPSSRPSTRRISTCGPRRLTPWTMRLSSSRT
jgi:hypothetical protein